MASDRLETLKESVTEFAIGLRIEMDDVALMRKTLGAGYASSGHLVWQTPVRRVDAFLVIVPWTFRKLSHLSSNERDLGRLEVPTKPRNQVVEFLFVGSG